MAVSTPHHIPSDNSLLPVVPSQLVGRPRHPNPRVVRVRPYLPPHHILHDVRFLLEMDELPQAPLSIGLGLHHRSKSVLDFALLHLLLIAVRVVPSDLVEAVADSEGRSCPDLPSLRPTFREGALKVQLSGRGG